MLLEPMCSRSESEERAVAVQDAAGAICRASPEVARHVPRETVVRAVLRLVDDLEARVAESPREESP